MKIDLMGAQTRSIFYPKSPIYWEVWLDEDYSIACGYSRDKISATKAANEAFKRWQTAISRVKKLSYTEWA